MPELLADDAWMRLDDDKRSGYDEDRLDHHSRLLVVETTAITQLGKMTEVIHRRRYPRSGSDIPVIYITAPSAATSKMIAAEFARFLGLPVTRQAR